MGLPEFTELLKLEQQKILRYSQVALSIIYLQGEESLGKIENEQTRNQLAEHYCQIFGKKHETPK